MDGTVLVEARHLLESMDYAVEWDGAAGAVVVKKISGF
jgi:hypothetical protein